MTNAANRKQVRELEKEAARAEATRLEVVRALMSNAQGRGYVYAQLAATHVFHTSFSPSDLQLAFNEGERNVGLQLLGDVTRAAPDEFITMLKEHNDHDDGNRARADDRDDDDGDGSASDGDDGTSNLVNYDDRAA